MLSCFMVAEASTGLIYHRPLGENSSFQFQLFLSFLIFKKEPNHKFFKSFENHIVSFISNWDL